jgi:hypothetical protein
MELPSQVDHMASLLCLDDDEEEEGVVTDDPAEEVDVKLVREPEL